MGKTKTAVVRGETQKEDSEKKYKHKRSLTKESGAQKVRVPGLKGGERVVAVAIAPLPETTVPETPTTQKTRPHKRRSNRYLAAISKIDPTKRYSIPEAIDLARQTSISRFNGKLEMHLTLDKKGTFEVNLPHSNGISKKRVEIAKEDTIKKLEQGNIYFDILVSTPDFMPRLAPFARLLGPRGLMPNPKNGTVATDPLRAAEKFSGNTLFLKTEKDAPVVHTVVGSLSDPETQLVENTQTILKTLGLQNIKKAVLAPTMGPGIKVAI